MALNLLKIKHYLTINDKLISMHPPLPHAWDVTGKTMEWISIEERLPSCGERVLLFTPYDFFGKDNTCIGDRESIDLCTIVVEEKTVSIFTHWLPLPATPREQVSHPANDVVK